MQAMMVNRDHFAAAPAPVPKLELNEARERSYSPSNSRRRAGQTTNEWADDQAQFAHLPPLPPGWLRILARGTRKIYYCHQETGETTFQEPVGPPASVLERQSLPPGGAQNVSQRAILASQYPAPMQIHTLQPTGAPRPLWDVLQFGIQGFRDYNKNAMYYQSTDWHPDPDPDPRWP